MNWLRSLVASSILLVLGALPSHSYGNVCVYKTPTVHDVQGSIVDRSGWPIPNAQVRVLQGEKTIQSVLTGESGQFRFDSLEDGKYEVDVTARGFQHARYIVKLSSLKKPKQALRITLGIGFIYCQGSIEVIRQESSTH